MRLPTLGAKYQTNIIQVKNGEASATLPNGTPVILVFNGTDDGLAVVLPATAGALLSAYAFAGVVENASSLNGIAAGQIGDVFAYGLCLNAIIGLVTRSATTAVWPSYPALTTGQPLTINTVYNCFTLAASTQVVQTGTASTDTIGLPVGQMGGAMGVVAQTLASATTQATNSANSATVSTNAIKVFLRMM